MYNYRKMLPLERLCLDLIVEKFELLFFSFTVSKNIYIQQQFRFLQKRFSHQLITALFVEGKLKKEYFQLLINEHLNLLVGRWFKNSFCLMECIFRRLPNLTRVCYRDCGDEILENVAKFCPKIVEIDVRCSNVTDNGVKCLYEIKNGIVPCPELKNLFIKYSLITDKGAECLIRNLPSLEMFDYPNAPLLLHFIHKNKGTYKKIKLEKVYSHNLIELNLSQFPKLFCYTDVLKTSLIVCPKLESIACYISDKEELNLFTKSSLKKLHLEFCIKDPEINIDDFLKINECNLTSLRLSNPSGKFETSCQISVSVLAERCPALKEFYSHNVRFTNDNDYCFPVIFPSLTKCSFSHIDTSDVKPVCLFLTSSPKLESVSFRFMLMLPDELKSVILTWCKNPSAKLIEFVYLYLEKEFILDILVNCVSIKSVFLYECLFDDLDINNFLNNVTKEQCIKPRIFVRKYNPWMSDIDELADMYFISHNTIFNDIRLNLENYLKEEYRCSTIYESLFIETAFSKNHSCIVHNDDDWCNNWEIISS